MAENDIYNNEKRYNAFVENLEHYTKEPTKKDKRRKYIIKNPENLKYYHILLKKYEALDISYIRRLRLLRSLLIITHIITKDLKDATRDDLDNVMVYFNKQKYSPKTYKDFVLDIKYIWKIILPEKDEKGRINDHVFPYVVSHLSPKVDKSREKRREDRFTLDEFEKLLGSFGRDIRMKAFLSLAFESLARPQELCYIRIKDVELSDNYAKIWVSEHGKEGIKFLSCIDSFPYVADWYNQHPKKHDPEAFFFCSLASNNLYNQLSPYGINKQIRIKCKELGIKRNITCYSLKRNGITLRRLRGDSDVTIQHTAGWTSTKQLKTYDKSDQDDVFKIELIKRGLIEPDETTEHLKPQSKKCVFCGCNNGLGESICRNCKRPLNRETIEQEAKQKDSKIQELEQQIKDMPSMIIDLLKEKPEVLREALKKSKA